MATILCTGADSALLETRRLILEHAGHSVITATNGEAVIAACKKTDIQVAVIGQSVSPHNKKVIASLVRQHCPATKILELYQPHQGRAIIDAESWLEVPADVPQQLAERVSSMLSSNR